MAGLGDEYGWPPPPLGPNDQPAPWEVPTPSAPSSIDGPNGDGASIDPSAPPATEPDAQQPPVPPDQAALPPPGPPSEVFPPPPPPPGGALEAPPPMPAPDAISGVGPIPQQTVAGQPDITIRPETHADEFTGHPWDNPVAAERDAAARSLAISDPVAFQAYATHLAESKIMAEAAARHRADAANLQAAKDDVAARQIADAKSQAKSQQILADSQALAAKSIDRRHWFTSKSTLQKLLTLGSAIVGGLAAGKSGGRNVAMDWIGKEIDDDINNQKADIENQRAGLTARSGAVAQEFARTGDLYHAAETVRLASYQSAINDLQTTQQDYDPRGTSFANIGRGIQQIAAAHAQAGEQVRKTTFDEGLKIEKARQEAEQQAEVRRHNRAEESIAWQREAREGKKDKADNTLLTPQQIHEQFPALPIAAIPPDGATIAQLGKRTETYNKTLETADKTRAASGDERSRQLAVGEVVDDKGEPVLFRDPSHAGKLADSKGAVDSATQLIDRINAARAKYGWSSDLLRSEEWRRMQADYGALVLQKKTTDQLGVLSEGDMELIGKSLGTTDPTEARDPTPGLKAARENMINNVNAQIRGQAVLPKGRTVARWEPPAPPEVHRETPDERADKDVLTDPLRWEGNRLFNESGLAAREVAAAGTRGSDLIWQAALAKGGGMAPSQRSTLDAWGAEALGPDPAKRDKAVALLSGAIADAEVPAVRAYAQQLLDRVGAGAEPGLAPEQTGPELGVAHETVPPLLFPPPTGVR